MSRVISSAIKRNKSRPNYAMLNRKGFSSVKINRTKKVTLRDLDTISLPNTPKVSKQKKTVKVKVNNTQDSVNATDDAMHLNLEKISVNALHENTINDKDLNRVLLQFANSNDMDDLKGMSLEEKKRFLRQKNAEMEAVLEEQESEDDELRQLLEQQEQLQRKLSNSDLTPGNKKKTKGMKGSKVDNAQNRTNMCKKVNKEVGKEYISDTESGEVKIIKSRKKGQDECLPDLNRIKDILHVVDKKTKRKKDKKTRKGRRKHRRRHYSSSDSSSSDSSESESASSDSETEDTDSEEDRKKKKRGKRMRSGIYAKPGNTNIISEELFANSTLDDEIGGYKNLEQLSFNLLVAGELEIISDGRTPKYEKDKRLKILKMLAYKAEYLSRDEILRQYKNFIQRVERGVYRWGSKSDVRKFEQHLVYCISIENRQRERKSKVGRNFDSQKFNDKFSSRVKYCLEYNRGTCNFDGGHEGKINGQGVFKEHICKWCLVKEGKELKHAEKDCNQARK